MRGGRGIGLKAGGPEKANPGRTCEAGVTAVAVQVEGSVESLQAVGRGDMMGQSRPQARRCRALG